MMSNKLLNRDVETVLTAIFISGFITAVCVAAGHELGVGIAKAVFWLNGV